MTTTTRTFSAAQEAYMLARAAYDVANTAASAEWVKVDHLADTEMAAWEVEAERIEVEYPTQAAYDALVAAEAALINWGHAVIRNAREYRAQRALLGQLFTAAERDVITRRKVVDLTMKLAA